jgi:hypothetical protein
VELRDFLSGQALLLIFPAIVEDTKNISINVTKSAKEIYGLWLGNTRNCMSLSYYTNIIIKNSGLDKVHTNSLSFLLSCTYN